MCGVAVLATLIAQPMYSFLGFRIFEFMAVFTGDIPSVGYESSAHDARVSSEHCLEVPSTALFPNCAMFWLRAPVDHSVCLNDPKVSATIHPR